MPSATAFTTNLFALDLGKIDPSRKVKSGDGAYLGTLIYVRTPSGDVLSLDISKETTISDLKAILASELLHFPGAKGEDNRFAISCTVYYLVDLLLLYHGEQELDSDSHFIDNGTTLRLSFKLSNGEDIASYSPTFNVHCGDIAGRFTHIGVDETLGVELYATTGGPSSMLLDFFAALEP